MNGKQYDQMEITMALNTIQEQHFDDKSDLSTDKIASLPISHFLDS